MKSFIFISLYLIAFFPGSLFSHGGHSHTNNGGIGTNLQAPWISPLPMSIELDGSVGFHWDWYGFAPQEHGTTDHTHTTIEEGHNHDENMDMGGHEEESPWAFDWFFEPMVALNFDKYKQYVNLEEHSINKSLMLESACPSTGYLVLEKGTYSLGGGVTFHGHNHLGLHIGFGLLPTGGANFYSERFAPDRKSAENLPTVRVPRDEQSLDSWNVNDILVYEKQGGITFFAHGGYSGLTVGAGYGVTGLWKVFLKKTAKRKLFAQVSKITLHSLNVSGGVEFATVNLGVFGNEDKSFAFEFDLNGKNGNEALEKFLDGNFKFAQKLAKDNSMMSGVRVVSLSDSKSLGRAFGVHMGLPFLGSLDFSKSLVRSFSKVSDLHEGGQMENTMAIYSRSVLTSGFLSKRTNKTSIFAASHQEHLQPKHEGHNHNRSYSTANFKWLYSRSRVDAKDMEYELDNLKRITGLWKTIDFEYPQDKMGYTKLEFDTMISSRATNNLLNNKSAISMATVAQNKIETFFQNDENPGRLCKVLRSAKRCKAKLEKVTAHAMKKMEQRLSQMRKWNQAKNWKEFTKSFAGLGEEAITNQFTFQTFLEMLGKENFKMEFKISGERLKVLTLKNFQADL